MLSWNPIHFSGNAEIWSSISYSVHWCNVIIYTEYFHMGPGKNLKDTYSNFFDKFLYHLLFDLVLTLFLMRLYIYIIHLLHGSILFCNFIFHNWVRLKVSILTNNDLFFNHTFMIKLIIIWINLSFKTMIVRGKYFSKCGKVAYGIVFGI